MVTRYILRCTSIVYKLLREKAQILVIRVSTNTRNINCGLVEPNGVDAVVLDWHVRDYD